MFILYTSLRSYNKKHPLRIEVRHNVEENNYQSVITYNLHKHSLCKTLLSDKTKQNIFNNWGKCWVK